MLEATAVPDSDVLEVTIDGAISADAMKRLHAQLAEFLEAHEHPGLLVVYTDIGEIPPGAMLEDLRNVEFLPRIERAAVVADQRWIRGLTELGEHVVPTEVKVFHQDARDEALAWLRTPAA